MVHNNRQLLVQLDFTFTKTNLKLLSLAFLNNCVKTY